MDRDNSGTISRDEFQRHLRSGKLKAHLVVLGLDIKDAESFFDMMAGVAGDDEEVSIDEFVQGCHKLKGGATGVDVQQLMYETKRLHKDLGNFAHYCKGKFAELGTRREA
mmetsp:Transcript_92658/g.188707  ORF Transcript_92658/g.188707 Transcript_92658/m.188707 type:complete len:110 (+) Transcript_92658:2-331(+)